MFDDVSSEVLTGLLADGALLQVPTADKPPGGAPVRGTVMVNRDADTVYKVVTDLEAYPGFMPNTDRLRILKRSGSVLTTEHRLKMKFGIISTKIDYILTHELDPEKLTMTFRHKSGALSSVRGGWRVRELAPDRTAATYTLTLDFREAGFVAKKALNVEPALQTALQVSTVSMTLNALKARLEN